MLDQIKAMERAGQWADIRRQGPALVAGLQGNDLARAYIAIGRAHELTSANGADYRTALRFMELASVTAVSGSLMEIWALHYVASYRADLGDYRGAEQAATRFFTSLPHHPAAEAVAPWVYAALGRVRSSQKRFTEAIALYRQAKSAVDCGFAERLQLLLVWAYAQAGRVQEAVAECPSDVQHVHPGLLHAATAVTLAAAGDWRGAQVAAKAALPHYSFQSTGNLPTRVGKCEAGFASTDADKYDIGVVFATGGELASAGKSISADRFSAPVYDIVEAAELCLILKLAAEHLGQSSQAAVWRVHSAALLSGWNAGLCSDLLPTLRAEGGVFADAATSHCGPAGHARCGLLGTVG